VKDYVFIDIQKSYKRQLHKTMRKSLKSTQVGTL